MLFFLIFPYEFVYFLAKTLTQQGTHVGAPGVKMSQRMRGSRGESTWNLYKTMLERSIHRPPSL